MVEKEEMCNIQEEERRLESNKNRKMKHRKGETEVVERKKREQKKEGRKERQKGYNPNSRITFCLRIQFVP